MDNYLREDGRVNITECIKSGLLKIDETESRGARPKYWLNDYEIMYKQTYAESYEDYAELIAYELASLLGVKCAYYDLAKDENGIGVITYNIIDEAAGEEMIAGSELISEIYYQYIMPIFKIKEEYIKIKEKYNIYNEEDYYASNLENQEGFIKELSRLTRINNLNKRNLDINNAVELIEMFDDISDLYNEDFNEMKGGIIKSNNLYDIWSVVEMYSKLNKIDANINEIMKL